MFNKRAQIDEFMDGVVANPQRLAHFAWYMHDDETILLGGVRRGKRYVFASEEALARKFASAILTNLRVIMKAKGLDDAKIEAEFHNRKRSRGRTRFEVFVKRVVGADGCVIWERGVASPFAVYTFNKYSKGRPYVVAWQLHKAGLKTAHEIYRACPKG